jgi:hypothetical protein
VRRLWAYLVGIFGPDPFAHVLAPDPGRALGGPVPLEPRWLDCGHAHVRYATDAPGRTWCPACWAYQQAQVRSPLWEAGRLRRARP